MTSNSPDYEKEFWIYDVEQEEELLTIQLFNIEYQFIKGDHPNGSPPDRDTYEITGYESKIISLKDGIDEEIEIKDETEAKGLISHFIDMDDVLKTMIPIWEDQ